VLFSSLDALSRRCGWFFLVVEQFVPPGVSLLRAQPASRIASMDFFSALLLSLLPPYYRRTLQGHAGSYLLRGAVVTSIAEVLLAAIFYARGFIDYARDAYMPPVAFLEYFFAWKGLLCAAFFIDGAIRLLATFARQALGIFPIYIAAWTHAALSRRSARKSQPALIADLVEGPSPSGELKISSCRSRKNWDKWMTIMYEDNLYEIAHAELQNGPRPYVYLLRPKPESKVIRGLHRYDPNEVFRLEGS
jgi:hypothetical protein